ncbi:MAG: bifunctional UDP-N-acetylglucosamine diphosphorylase/glucosamine-1-phosphate N-acetyltransferase GlmU [Clostridiales bacterium]|nr:bifunctional UDP-N-acetylglucosamine diphosphorylase/glucosamine-1-phosphate N-acetyltransferase GlmU [Clostridiales bacterium]
MNKLRAIILAAGEGTRMRSKTSKVLHSILNRPMIHYVLDAAKQSGAEKTCIVIGHKGEEVRKSIEQENVEFVVQQERLGTGHAVMMAKGFITEDSDILVLYGDTPLIQGDTLKKLVEFHRKNENSVSIISAKIAEPTGYGRIIRDEKGSFMKNVEHKDATEEERKICEVNTGVYCFRGKSLLSALGQLKNDNIQKEYYLPDTLQIILKGGEKVDAMLAEDVTEFFGINSRVQLAQATELMKNRINKYWMEQGVTLIDPSQTYISPQVQIGMDTILYPGTILEGKTVIGEGCMIGPNTRVSDGVLGCGVTAKYSTIMESSIGDRTTVGPYAYIRPNCSVGEDVRLGDFVEVKNSKIGNGTKVSHLTYIGDSDVGCGINFGCGTVTVNYDGKKKYRTVIEDNAFIGCNTNLIAPVTVGKSAYIAAGSTITKDIPSESLAVARSRQENIKGWTKRK